MLSAYLDGELSGREREQFERQLQNDDALQHRYEELKRTRVMLRSMPPLRAPRNFLLTPEMVGQKEKFSRAFPILRFASAFAAFLLVLLFLGDFFVIPSPVLAPMRSVQIIESVELEEEPAAAEADTFASQPPAAVEEPAMEAAPAAPMEGEPAAEEDDENISTSMGTDKSMDKITALPTEPLGGIEEMLAGTAGAVAGDAISEQELAPEEILEDEMSITQNPRTILRIAEIALLVIAISTGLVAYLLYRKTST